VFVVESNIVHELVLWIDGDISPTVRGLSEEVPEIENERGGSIEGDSTILEGLVLSSYIENYLEGWSHHETHFDVLILVERDGEVITLESDLLYIEDSLEELQVLDGCSEQLELHAECVITLKINNGVGTLDAVLRRESPHVEIERLLWVSIHSYHRSVHLADSILKLTLLRVELVVKCLRIC
jgi:hypothetical protein